MNTWRVWTTDLPAPVMSSARLIKFPPLPKVPEPMRGRAFVIVEAVLQESAAVADSLLTGLRLLEPAMDTFAPTTPVALSALHMDPPGPVPGVGDGVLIRDFEPETIDAFLGVVATPRGDSLLGAELRMLGGALAPRQSSGGVVSGLDGRYAMFTGGFGPTPETATAIHAAIDDLKNALAPWRSDRDYLNFTESPVAAERLFGEDLHRLVAIKRRVDPQNLIQSNHSLSRTASADRSTSRPPTLPVRRSP